MALLNQFHQQDIGDDDIGTPGLRGNLRHGLGDRSLDAEITAEPLKAVHNIFRVNVRLGVDQDQFFIFADQFGTAFEGLIDIVFEVLHDAGIGAVDIAGLVEYQHLVGVNGLQGFGDFGMIKGHNDVIVIAADIIEYEGLEDFNIIMMEIQVDNGFSGQTVLEGVVEVFLKEVEFVEQQENPPGVVDGLAGDVKAFIGGGLDDSAAFQFVIGLGDRGTGNIEFLAELFDGRQDASANQMLGPNGIRQTLDDLLIFGQIGFCVEFYFILHHRYSNPVPCSGLCIPLQTGLTIASIA